MALGVLGCQPTTGHFSTRSPSTALPTGAACAAKVRPTPEVRAANKQANQTRGKQKNLATPYPEMKRVDGNKVGTTDELIQWAACKWGIDEDIVRAQAAVESWWYQRTLGDFTSDASACIPGHKMGADGHAGACPASGGLLALTYRYYQGGFPEAMTSTAYNLDYVYAWWRACYTGKITWFNDVDKGRNYAAGDVWGCVGAWFAGRWHTSAAEGYIAKVKDYENRHVWTTASFKQG